MNWSVSVEREGERIVTLSSNGMGGRELSAEDEDTIRTAAQHLLSFVGTQHMEDSAVFPRSERRTSAAASRENVSEALVADAPRCPEVHIGSQISDPGQCVLHAGHIGEHRLGSDAPRSTPAPPTLRDSDIRLLWAVLQSRLDAAGPTAERIYLHQGANEQIVSRDECLSVLGKLRVSGSEGDVPAPPEVCKQCGHWKQSAQCHCLPAPAAVPPGAADAREQELDLQNYPDAAALVWIRRKLKLPADAAMFHGHDTIAGRLHVVCANADSYRWMSEYRDNEYHAWVAEKAELLTAIARLKRVAPAAPRDAGKENQ